MLFRSEGNMTSDADVEENDPNGHEDEGEHPEDLQNETEDAASASTCTSTSATSTPWSAILVVVVVIHFITLYICTFAESKAATNP